MEHIWICLDPIALTGYWDGEFSRDLASFIAVSVNLLENQMRFVIYEDGETSVSMKRDIQNIEQ